MFDWNVQEQFYQKQMKHANDGDIFKWSVFLKDTNKCIGLICGQKVIDQDENYLEDSILDVGWYLDPIYQGRGYATEATTKMIDYMFNDVEINEIRTGAAVANKASWKIMEKLGFEQKNYIVKIKYTFLDEPVDEYLYTITKEKYRSINSQKVYNKKNYYNQK